MTTSIQMAVDDLSVCSACGYQMQEDIRDQLCDACVEQGFTVVDGTVIGIPDQRDPYEVYGTPEHEWLLMAEERGER